jgi:hypothetical protein
VTARYIDLLKQGFMRPLKTKQRKEPPPVVACDDCLNWHRKGQHTSSQDVRKQRRLERMQTKKQH